MHRWWYDVLDCIFLQILTEIRIKHVIFHSLSVITIKSEKTFKKLSALLIIKSYHIVQFFLYECNRQEKFKKNIYKLQSFKFRTREFLYKWRFTLIYMTIVGFWAWVIVCSWKTLRKYEVFTFLGSRGGGSVSSCDIGLWTASSSPIKSSTARSTISACTASSSTTKSTSSTTSRQIRE